MNSTDKALCEHILQVAQALHSQNMLAAADGNISFKVYQDYIFITPSGVAKARMDIEDMAVVNSQGRVMVGKASSEMAMHLAVYNSCPKAKAIVHAHPPTAIAWSIARPDDTELPSDAMSELILSVGSVPIVPYARPGTEEMGSVLKSYLPQHRCLILARHGALSWGEDLEEAHKGMERIEHTAIILEKAQRLGSITTLPKEEVSYLKEIRKSLGERIL